MRVRRKLQNDSRRAGHQWLRIDPGRNQKRQVRQRRLLQDDGENVQ